MDYEKLADGPSLPPVHSGRIAVVKNESRGNYVL